MIKTLFTLLTILNIGLFDIYACNCQGDSSVKEAIKNSDVVIVGKVISQSFIDIPDRVLIKETPKDSLVHKFYPFVHRIKKYKIQIEKIYKGKIEKDTIEILSGNGGGDCGNKFNIGGEYIVYGKNETYIRMGNNNYDYPKGPKYVWTNICMRTSNYSELEVKEIENVFR